MTSPPDPHARIDRRRFLHDASGSAAAGMLGRLLPPSLLAACSGTGGAAIDRRALVARHSPVVRGHDPLSVLSVGNGNFAFTADVTGLQSFPDRYREIPLAIQSSWGWHRFPNPDGVTLDDALSEFDVDGRPVPYADRQNLAAGSWLRQNPHRLSLAGIGFVLQSASGAPLPLEALDGIDQHLDLWTGTLSSRFLLDGQRLTVSTWAHPTRDLIAVRVEAPTLPGRQWPIRIAFPYGAAVHTGDPADWSVPDRHRTTLSQANANAARWQRSLDADSYWARARWSDGGRLASDGPHSFLLTPGATGRFELVLEFAPEIGTWDRIDAGLPTADAVRAASDAHWQSFWSSGGAIDMADSTDPRAPELERRIVLSQYLTAIQCSGSQPPQETGLTFNSWHGKFHLEMHWWHAVHFALWGRLPLLENSLPWYREILPQARATAAAQGYAGARWPKMVGPDGRESPSTIGVFLIWQQPHPIYLAELVYRNRPETAVLESYREIVFESAAFMASYPRWNEAEQRYMLGPPLIPAQELHPARTTFNPTFELAYWAFGLETAQLWRERLGLPRDSNWDHVLDNLSPLPLRDGLYTNAESDLATFSDSDKRRDHPTLLGAFGFIGSPAVDTATMRRTLERVMTDWQWDETWGWDYPLTAMTAARLGEPELAIEALMMETEKNRFLPNGHNFQREGLTIYLPGNGGLLTAVAMMAAGWTGGPETPAPGFPKAGWSVRYEGLSRAI